MDVGHKEFVNYVMDVAKEIAREKNYENEGQFELSK